MEYYLIFLSISAFVAFVFLGYRFPRRSGWGVLLTLPLLGPGIFSIVPSATLPLTINRAAVAIAVGMLFRNYSEGFSLRALFKSKVFILLLLFLLGVLLKSFDDRFVNMVFTWIPNWLTPFIICFLLIRDDHDLQLLAKIISWQTAIIGFFIILEYFTKYNIGLTILHTSPDPVYSYYTYERSGYFRPAGLYLNSVFTGFYFAFAFPIVLWYARRTRITGIILALISFAAITLLQTRAVYISAFLSIVLILITRDLTSIKKLFALSCLALIVIVSYSDFSKWTESIYKENIVESFATTDKYSDVNVRSKLERIPRAWEFFLERPITGYLSPVNALWYIMNGDDIPSPFLYLLSGGIFLCLIYVSMILALPITTFRLSRDKMVPYRERMFLYYAGVSFLSGIIVVFSNACEDHFPIMFMLYASIYKVYVYNRHQSRIDTSIYAPTK